MNQKNISFLIRNASKITSNFFFDFCALCGVIFCAPTPRVRKTTLAGRFSKTLASASKISRRKLDLISSAFLNFIVALLVPTIIGGAQATDKKESNLKTMTEKKMDPQKEDKDETKAEAKSGSKQVNGAGASFPYPVYSQWAEVYRKDIGINVNYQSIGSGGGIKAIKAGTVQFGASDKPLKKNELEHDDLIQFPAIIGGVVIIINIAGIKDSINLTADIVSKIYRGEIKKWNDEAITKENPTITFPDKEITVIHRSDGSGTTFLFSSYLAGNDKFWKEGEMKPGNEIKWPTGFGGKGNDGVAGNVKQNMNSIGYVEFSYAKQHSLNTATLTNNDGKIVKAQIETFSAAAQNAKWDETIGYYQVLTNQPGADSWPITGASFILLKKGKTGNKEVIDFFKWAFKNGKQMSIELDYVHLPESLIAQLGKEVLAQ